MKKFIICLSALSIIACAEERLPAIEPDVITEKTPNDTDDPAIWVNPDDASKSIVFGTDKDTNGGIYAFDLDGKIIKEKCILNVQRPNNVDLRYGFQLNDSVKTDIIAFTEREKQQIRVFSVPDMTPLDGGGIPVFTDETDRAKRLPMGISLYKSPETQKMYAIVGRKAGPKENYLYQYELKADSLGVVSGSLVRKFGDFSGKKEIEAIAVDDEMGFVYYSDEMDGVKKYYAEPSKGNERVAFFGNDNKFSEDIEGIAIANTGNGEGYIIVSDQQMGYFNVFSRKDNSFIKAINLSTTETDGCDVVTTPLNSTFKTGLFAAMNDDASFYFYDFSKLGLE
ncbi:phytase [Pustulibacterium marinum]|nr:phytase [Pustulibacterium marinum]